MEDSPLLVHGKENTCQMNKTPNAVPCLLSPITEKIFSLQLFIVLSVINGNSPLLLLSGNLVWLLLVNGEKLFHQTFEEKRKTWMSGVFFEQLDFRKYSPVGEFKFSTLLIPVHTCTCTLTGGAGGAGV